MKRLLSLVIIFALALSACSLTACDLIDQLIENLNIPLKPSEGLAFEPDATGEGYMLVGIGECDDVNIVIPSTYEGKPVTEINAKAFRSNESIKSVYIHDGITYIGYEAFAYCPSLKNVTLPSTLTRLGEAVFMLSTSLKSIKIPQSVTKIPDFTFFGCSSLESVSIHNDITYFGVNSFTGCISLKNLDIPKGVTAERFQAVFGYLNSLEDFRVDPNNPDFFEIDGNLYYKAHYSDSEERNYLFSYAMGRDDEEFTVPSGISAIYAFAFSFLPWDIEEAETMDKPDFDNMKYRSNLKRVIISEGVDYIMENAFALCTDLGYVSLPSTITRLEESTFFHCPNLNSISYNGTVEEWEALEKEDDWIFNCPATKVKCTDGEACIHDWDSWQTLKEATSLENGLMERKCFICDKTEEKVIKAIKETLTVWLPTSYGFDNIFVKHISEFFKSNPELYKYDLVIKCVDTADTPSYILNDPDSAPDLFFFNQNDLDRLILGNALSSLIYASAEAVAEFNDTASVNAIQKNGVLYGYPMTSDNGYYMYYDTTIITNPDSLEQIIADVEAYNEANPDDKRYIRFSLDNAWYTSSFFFATGCTSEWILDTDGSLADFEDTFNSEAGLVAMKGMQKLAQSSAYSTNSDIATSSAVWVTGIWNSQSAEEYFKGNLGATDLPSFTVDGKSYHLSSFSGHKCLGVKPQSNSEKETILHKLAAHLSSKEVQLELYENFLWVPSNIQAQQSDGLKNNIHVQALAEQNKYAVPQRIIHGSWWDVAKVLGIDAAKANSDDELKNSLQKYEDTLHTLIEPFCGQGYAAYWSVIGSICGTNWDKDFVMNEIDSNIYESEPLALNVGEDFKVRYWGSWSTNFGVDGFNGRNFKVEENGVYVVRITVISLTEAIIDITLVE